MKAKKLTFFVALVMLALSGTANAMLPFMMLFMAPIMGMGHMTQNSDGRGDMVHNAKPAEGHDHTSSPMMNRQDGDATGGESRQEMPSGQLDPVGAAKE